MACIYKAKVRLCDNNCGVRGKLPSGSIVSCYVCQLLRLSAAMSASNYVCQLAVMSLSAVCQQLCLSAVISLSTVYQLSCLCQLSISCYVSVSCYVNISDIARLDYSYRRHYNAPEKWTEIYQNYVQNY